MISMNHYYFEGDSFVIENYNKQKTFANFLPGVAGKKGIPLWSFYVNRGQGISGFGLQDKNKPIMTFTPANKAYESVNTIGFRTFIKTKHGLYEPFKIDGIYPNKMKVNKASFSIEEVNEDLNLKITVTYFGLPNMPIAALTRKVTVENMGDKALDMEMLDGLAEILPSGVQNANFKEMSNLLASWMDVEHLNDQLGFFKLRASTNDSSEVTALLDGNFYIGIADNEVVTPLVDQDLVFGYNTAKTTPVHFQDNDLNTIQATKQITANKVPCAFIPIKKTLEAKTTLTLYASSGYTHDYDTLKQFKASLTDAAFLDQKFTESKNEIDALLKDVKTSTAYEPFNHYIEQNYLDNFLRGGYPEKIGDSIYHLYSRRHGDLERDYNFFSLAPEYYSQGSGNFRDVCQNRRMDTFINKDVEHFNIHHFASLIQLDGYNPLSVNGTLYELTSEKVDALMAKHFEAHAGLKALLNEAFTPGKLVNFVENNHISIKTSETEYLNDIITSAESRINAAFGEGYWSDHFTYVLDLVESYEGIYPDNINDLLYNDASFLFFESPVSVRPKIEKSVITKDNQVRQYGSLYHYDEEKIKALNLNPHGANWAKVNNEEYKTTLFVKLLSLTMNKHSLLDPDGFGIEMEGDKPGWNDAMNGVPGLFGSGVSETIETLRIVEYLLAHQQEGTVTLPKEMVTLYQALAKENHYNDRLSAREQYREAIRFGLSGEDETVKLEAIFNYLKALRKTLQEGLRTLYQTYDHIVPTFLVYEVTKHEPLKENGKAVIGHYKYPLTKPLEYKRRALPKFLEAPARLLKTDFTQSDLLGMHEAIKKSGIYDASLNMFKTSECLENETHEIGRIRAFTKGWLERESNFLHMNYKYLLGLISAGLYEEYYEAIKNNLTCFMDPSVYGRNTLENSSFIAPTNNPNHHIHGHGFFARLSGSTVETINMWAIMMTGAKPFKYENNTLVLRFEPKLHASFFKADNKVSFTFLKTIEVEIHNPNRVNTYESFEVDYIELSNDQDTKRIQGNTVIGSDALAVRDGLYNKIHIEMKK